MRQGSERYPCGHVDGNLHDFTPLPWESEKKYKNTTVLFYKAGYGAIAQFTTFNGL